MKNIIQTQMTAADRAKFDEGLALIESSIEGKMSALTEDERSKYGSVNEQNKLLVNKAHDYRQNQPAMSSPDVDWDEFESDYQARTFLESRSDRLKSIIYQMTSTKILHDHDNYQDALTDYGHAQYKKGAGEPGYAGKVAEMKQFFNRTKKIDEETTPEEENANG